MKIKRKSNKNDVDQAQEQYGFFMTKAEFEELMMDMLFIGLEKRLPFYGSNKHNTDCIKKRND